jgi:predicted nicotinamide N-methyase
MSKMDAAGPALRGGRRWAGAAAASRDRAVGSLVSALLLLGSATDVAALATTPTPAVARPNEFYLRGAASCDPSARTVEVGSSFREGTRRFLLPGRAVPLTVRETSFGEGKLGYQLWTSGVALATYVSLRPALVRGKRVLELGSGIGLAGLACAGHARSVTLSDMDRVSPSDYDSPYGLLESLRRSVGENGYGEGVGEGGVSVRRIDWRECGEGPAGIADDDDRFDVVLASDCVYYAELLPPLLAALRRFLARDGTAYVLSTERGYVETDGLHASPARFGDALRDAGWCEVTEERFACVTPYSDEEQVLHRVCWRRAEAVAEQLYQR